MRLRFGFFLCVLLTFFQPGGSVAATDPLSKKPPPPQIVFGAQTMAILMGATRVETFRIGGEQTYGCILERRQFACKRYGVKDYREIDEYPITAAGPVKGAVFATRLKQALFDLLPYPYNDAA